jgi:hypothetical protein
MKTESSLPCPQEHSTGPYPKPIQSTPSQPIFLRSILILPTHLRLGLPSALFPSGFSTKILYAFVVCQRKNLAELYRYVNRPDRGGVGASFSPTSECCIHAKGGYSSVKSDVLVPSMSEMH